MSSVNENIRKIRMENNMSQQELSEKLNYRGNSIISKIENGNQIVTAEIIQDLSRIFNVSPEYFFTGENKKEYEPFKSIKVFKKHYSFTIPSFILIGLSLLLPFINVFNIKNVMLIPTTIFITLTIYFILTVFKATKKEILNIPLNKSINYKTKLNKKTLENFKFMFIIMTVICFIYNIFTIAFLNLNNAQTSYLHTIESVFYLIISMNYLIKLLPYNKIPYHSLINSNILYLLFIIKIISFNIILMLDNIKIFIIIGSISNLFYFIIIYLLNAFIKAYEKEIR